MENSPVLISSDTVLKETVSLALESLFSMNVQTFSEAPNLKNFSMLIYDCSEIKRKPDFVSMLHEIEDKYDNKPCLFIFENENSYYDQIPKRTGYQGIGKHQFLERLVDFIQILFQDGVISSQKANLSEYCPIRLSAIKLASELPADIYIKLSNKKFLKLFSKGAVFNRDELKRVSEKKVDQLFIKRSESIAFLKSYSLVIEEAGNNLKEHPELFLDQSLAIHSLLSESIREIGFTDEIQKIAITNAKTAINAFKTNKNILELVLKKLGTVRESYISWHSNLTSFLSCSIAKELTWTSDQTYMKLTMASMLHDVLISKDEIAKFENLNELYVYKISHEEVSQNDIIEFNSHPGKMAELVDKSQGLPPDLSVIILQHHERPDGEGFPGGINYKKISPLSALFIVAHDITTLLGRPETPRDLAQVKKTLEEKYNMGVFKKISDAAVTILYSVENH